MPPTPPKNWFGRRRYAAPQCLRKLIISHCFIRLYLAVTIGYQPFARPWVAAGVAFGPKPWSIPRSVLRRFVVVPESIENGEQGFLFGKAKAVIDTDLRLDMLHRLAVAAIQEAVCRSNPGGVGRLFVLHHRYQRLHRCPRVLARGIANVGDLPGRRSLQVGDARPNRNIL